MERSSGITRPGTEWRVKILRDAHAFAHKEVKPNHLLPPSQIIRHSKNLGESKDLKFDQIYMIK
jgi:hypothetical protein